MRDFSRDMARLASLDQDFAEESQALDEYLERARDLDMRLRRNAPESQAAELEKTEARLYEFSRLKRKLNRSMEQILNLKREIEDSLSEADSFALDMKRLDQQEAEAAKSLGEITANLNRARREAGDELARRLEQELRGLGFPEQAKTAFEFDGHEIYPGVLEDRPRIIWIPNPGLAPQPLDRIASGGELSRFLLATVSLMARKNLPTLIFDEVDAGVGGITLNRVGERLADLASRQQLLLITHWPQLAVLANKHFHVAKEVAGNSTHVHCRALTGGEVQAELTRMAGGGPLGEAMARELLSD
jgi:DNA repair protein RecN (Recombination protein N)